VEDTDIQAGCERCCGCEWGGAKVWRGWQRGGEKERETGEYYGECCRAAREWEWKCGGAFTHIRDVHATTGRELCRGRLSSASIINPSSLS